VNFKYPILIVAFSVMSACATPGAAYEESKNLSYEAAPDDAAVLKLMDPRIRSNLKDPDSLKNLKITSKYKCYASKMEISDNLSPKYDYGYWCYKFSYNGTNSYGAYVPGEDFAVYHENSLYSPSEKGETVRKSDDVWVYHSE